MMNFDYAQLPVRLRSVSPIAVLSLQLKTQDNAKFTTLFSPNFLQMNAIFGAFYFARR